MMKNTHSIWSQLVVAAVFAALTIVALSIYIKFAEPPERTPGVRFERNYDDAPLHRALTSAGIQQRLAEIRTAGMAGAPRQIGRFTGSPGFYATEQLITETFTQLGLDVHTQQFQVTVPVTEYCEILDEQGRPLPGVTLYPFEPSGLMPIITPPNGLTGKLLVTNSTQPLDLVGKPLEHSIVMNHGMNVAWPALASMGVQAVIVKESELERNANPDAPMPWNSMTTPYDFQYPRFFVRGPLEQYAGQELTVRCKVTWQAKTVRNIIAVLKATPEKTAREALVVNAYYDSNSVVPELAPGAEQAISLAAMLELARALAPYQGKLKRDVVFTAIAARGQAKAGTYTLLTAIEKFSEEYKDYKSLTSQQASHQKRLGYARRALEILESDDPWVSSYNAAYRDRWMKEDPAFRTWFTKAFATVAGEINLERREDYLKARIAWIRGGRKTFVDGFDLTRATPEQRKDPKYQHPLMKEYIDKKRIDTEAANVISTPFWMIAYHLRPKGADPDFFQQWGYRQRAREHFTELAAYHQRTVAELQDNLILRNEVFGPYAQLMAINLELYSGGQQKQKDLGVLVGVKSPGTKVEPQSTDLRNTLQEYVPMVNDSDAAFTVFNWGTSELDSTVDRPMHNTLDSEVWFRFNQLAFTIVNKSFFPPRIGTPDDTFESISPELVREHLPVVGKTMLAVANGRLTFKWLRPVPNIREFISAYGTVYTQAGTASIVPNHPMGGNTFAHLVWGGATTPSPTVMTRGVTMNPVIKLNPYGQYECKYLIIPTWLALTVDAARFDNNGAVTFYKNTSTSRNLFQNEGVDGLQLAVGGSGMKQLNLAMFRATQVACYQRINPKTFNGFPRFDFLQSLGMQPPEAIHTENAGPGIFAFMPPDANFYVAMMDGSLDNPKIQTYRAFMLNVEQTAGSPALSPLPQFASARDKGKHIAPIEEPELVGNGYLAADTPNLTFPYFDGAKSMLRTNMKRLILQNNYFMADAQMIESQRLGEEWLSKAEALREKGDPFSAVNAAGKAFALAISNHPVIRSKITNAVFGIIWYLAILVPFVFFFEKLLFGFTDIRKQLLAVGVIFIIFFLLLQRFHPAFQMVSSPLVILLGFLIFLLALAVTLMISGKFQQVVKSLRRREGQVEGADVNRGGVIGTAFMLGLNNMRRRKVRTGLTCVTLVLITFVMICFTSVSTNLVNVEYPTGKAPANGIIRRDPNFMPITDVEMQNIRQVYGLDYPVAVQHWLVGGADPAKKFNTTIDIDREYLVGAQKIGKRGTVHAAITMQWDEPKFSGVDEYLLTKKGWFPQPPDTPEALAKATAAGYKPQNYVIISDSLARELNVTPMDVDTGEPVVIIRTEEYVVRGIFDSVKLTNHMGMDGQSILPYNLNSPTNQSAMANNATAAQQQAQQLTRPKNIERLKGAEVIITNKAPLVQPGEQNIAVYCSILFPGMPYQLRSDLPMRPAVTYFDQWTVIQEYLERLGIGAYYAKNNMAYYGYRARKKTLEGLIELIIPILIAAMTVFNTMRGSVYERKDEIYVYNAVGIAPNHVFFMFMAEACVYAVIGAMLGYLLSQITGTVLVKLDLTSGLNMDYSSIETIYASLAIVASVLLSTLVPAHTASRMALPSDEMRWSVPKSEGDVMRFNLPFTFSTHDRMAVISYFYRWLDANGEGSSGSFFCAPPQLRLTTSEAETRSNGLVPAIETTIWLKPYDLGVSQRLTIDLPTDPETGEYIAHICIERLSGTISAWERAVSPFLGALRKQFLNWRAVSDAERTEMFEEARELFANMPATTVVTQETANV